MPNDYPVTEADARSLLRLIYGLNAPPEIVESDAIHAHLRLIATPETPYDELLARYLYLQCVQDQGAEVEGVRLYVERSILRLHNAGIDIVSNPASFFENMGRSIDTIAATRGELQVERAQVIRGWDVFDQTRPIPSIMFRWGTPMAILTRLTAEHGGLLSWLRTWRGAGEVVDNDPRLRMDPRYGLGKAIGHKASWLFTKLVTHTYGLMSETPGWEPNSYLLPLDSNVGRVLMRSGILFSMVSPEAFSSKVCTEQTNGRWNLAANKIRDLQIENDGDFRRLGLARRRVLSPRASLVPAVWGLLGALEEDRTNGSQSATIGNLDDGLMHVGLTYCKNDDPDCDSCPLARQCFAVRNREWITKYYCGTGTGTWAM